MNRKLILAVLLSFAFLTNSVGVPHVPVKAVHEASIIEQLAYEKLLPGENPDLGKSAFYPFASFIAGILTVLCLLSHGNFRTTAGYRIRLLLIPVFYGANYVKPFSLNHQLAN
ncbi:hypothetical protein FZC84_09090 [Rossellomorea vietnamensis]|uniref:Uncharacterized protein n=1 Tax=Rossellomorea vietnamensis TaxID=218284 RepID=A0A5D4MDK1_9BACI|nr:MULTISPECIES: hypothetical protein [Bacillaceae]TYR99954.1 hypothetical protein FZC84_09090 [Rossellomorea vietnamensis]